MGKNLKAFGLTLLTLLVMGSFVWGLSSDNEVLHLALAGLLFISTFVYIFVLIKETLED